MGKYPLHRIATAKLFGRGEKIYDLGGFEMQLDLSESVMMMERRDRVFETAVSDFLETQLETGDTYVDIGSNKGYHALEAANLVGPGGSVLAFEPNPRNYQDLIKNISLNDLHHVDAHEIAISSSDGEARFTEADNSGWGSLSESGDLTVQTRKLDTVLESENIDPSTVSLVKVDVEGAEINVLEGMGRFLNEGDSPVVVEIHDGQTEEVQEIAKSFGRSFDQLSDSHYVLG